MRHSAMHFTNTEPPLRNQSAKSATKPRPKSTYKIWQRIHGLQMLKN